MDPEQALMNLLKAAGEMDTEAASEAAESLREWIVRGGFIPTAAFVAMDERETRIVIGLIIDGAMSRQRIAENDPTKGSDPIKRNAFTGARECNHGHLWGSNDCGQCDGFNRPIKRRKGGGK